MENTDAFFRENCRIEKYIHNYVFKTETCLLEEHVEMVQFVIRKETM